MDYIIKIETGNLDNLVDFCSKIEQTDIKILTGLSFFALNNGKFALIAVFTHEKEYKESLELANLYAFDSVKNKNKVGDITQYIENSRFDVLGNFNTEMLNHDPVCFQQNSCPFCQ